MKQEIPEGMEAIQIEHYAEPAFGIQIPDGPFTLVVHGKEKCAGETCGIHNPSDHPLANAPRNWRADKGVMERICEHGIGHDDYDSVQFAIRMAEQAGRDTKYIGTHGCDGCCS